jgi:sortase A
VFKQVPEPGAGACLRRIAARPIGGSWTSRRRWIERGCYAAGSALLLFYAAARLDRGVYRLVQSAGVASGAAAAEVDQSLWSEGRIARFRESLALAFPAPLGVLRIPRLGLEVPVLEGIDDRTLNRAVGHVPGTAAPGEAGNVAIAGHRDGFFRGLKDLAVGDRLELEVGGERRLYAVESLRVVEPEAVEVLGPTAAPALTLVTCYPFYFVGNAPQRYIVRAAALPPGAAGEPAGTPQGR